MEMYWVIKASLELIFVMASMVVMSSGKSDNLSVTFVGSTPHVRISFVPKFDIHMMFVSASFTGVSKLEALFSKYVERTLD